MKIPHLATTMTTPILSLATLTAWFRNIRTRLFAVAMSLATFTPVFGQPVITVQPQSQSVSVGANVTLSVSANGFEPFSYQWRRNEIALAGETNAILTLTNVQFAHAGSYTVIVRDGFEESVTSEAAMLTVVADIFTKVTEGPGSDVGNSRGAAWGDYDNDGFIDLFVPNIGPGGSGSARHFLYHNNTNGTFSRVTDGPVAEVQSVARGLPGATTITTVTSIWSS